MTNDINNCNKKYSASMHDGILALCFAALTNHRELTGMELVSGPIKNEITELGIFREYERSLCVS